MSMSLLWVVPPIILGVMGCGRSEVPSMTIRILIDHSDSLDAFQAQSVQNTVLASLDSLSDVFAATKLDSVENHFILTLVRDMDTPHEYDSAAARLTLPVRYIRCKFSNWPHCGPWKRWNRKNAPDPFDSIRVEIDQVMDRLLGEGPYKHSYILRSLALPQKNPCRKNCRIWVVSDLLENSVIGNTRVNFYKHIPPYDSLRAQIVNTWGLPKVDSVKVPIFWLKRCPDEGGRMQDTPAFKEFWDDYFRDVTGTAPDWKLIPAGKVCA